MSPDAFAESRSGQWQLLQAAVANASKGRFRRMPVPEIERIAALYRSASSDLAIASRDFPDDQITIYLNGLCARAYALLHVSEPPRFGDLWSFIRRGYPQVFRKQLMYFWTSLAITMVGIITGGVAVYARPDLRAQLVPRSLFDLLAQGRSVQVPPSSITSGFVITNNIRVDLVLYALGLTFGIGTTLVLFLNGWMLGTLAAAVHQGNYDVTFWSYIIPHGAIELTVILIAGAAGLAMGHAQLRPGLLRRSDAVAAAAIDAVKLAFGVAALLCIAGLFEGFVSPSTLPVPIKYAIGVGNLAWLYAWLFLAGRTRTRTRGISLDLHDSWP